MFTQEYWKQILLTYLNIAGVTPVENLSAIPVYNLVKKDIPNEEQLASGDYVLIESISENDKVEKFVYKKSIGVFVDMKNIVDVDRSKIEFNEGDGKGKISFPLRKDLDGDTHLVANIGDELKIDFNEKDLNIFLKETGDLFRLRRNVILKMTKELYKEGDAKGF